MHSSTTAVLLLLALFGTSIVDACDEHAAQAMAFTLSTDVSTWNGATDMFGLTRHDFHVTLTSPGQYKTELQLDCCCDLAKILVPQPLSARLSVILHQTI